MSLSSGAQAPTIGCGGSTRPGRARVDGARATPRAPRPLVGRAGDDPRRPQPLRDLFGVRRDRERELLLRPVPLALLLALHHGELRAPGPAPGRPVVEPLAGDPHRRVPDRLPGHLLLLPPQLLPRVLLVAARVRRPRRPRALRRRDALPVRDP